MTTRPADPANRVLQPARNSTGPTPSARFQVVAAARRKVPRALNTVSAGRQGDMEEIREAAPDDAPALLEHLAAVFGEGLPGLFARNQAPSLERVAENIGACAASPNSVLLVAVEHGQIIGTLDFHGHTRPQQRHSGQFGMSVRREHRGAGIGTKLIASLLGWASEHEVTRIELEVFSNNPRAVRLYERLGFEHEGCRVGAVLVGTHPVDILLMARRLEA